MPKVTAQSRALRSFYAGGPALAGATGVCRGLSCELNGAADLHRRVAGTGPTDRVHCLGFCDRAPAARAPGGEVLFGTAALSLPEQVAPDSSGPDIRCLARRPVVTERLVLGPHHDLTVARDAGVYAALQVALDLGPGDVLALVEDSGELGRGGAGFPTGAKWRACAAAAGPRRYAVANGDEGDPGAFIDRLLLEDDPHAIIEGLVICGLAVGANEGIVFVRGEYPRAQARMAFAITQAREAGILGASVMGTAFAFDVRVVGGHGSYVCGEETALLNAIEGRRGEVRVRPPYPAVAGLHGFPTVVNNIETLVNVPWILREGVAAYRALGVGGAPGTKVFCLGRGFARPGIVEAEFGLDLRELVEQQAGGGRGGEPLAAVALGGPMGSILTPAEWGVALEPEALRRRGIRLGHGGVVPLPASVDLQAVLRNWAEFMALESCGKCAPCGLGSRRVVELVERMARSGGQPVLRELALLLETIEATSLCGFGQGLPRPLMRLASMAAAQAGGRGGA